MVMRCMFYRWYMNQYCTESTQTRLPIIKLINTLVHSLMRCVQWTLSAAVVARDP